METDDIQTGAVDAALEPDANKGPQTLMEQLRARRQEVAESRDTLIALPGYEEVGLQVKYRLMERKEVEAIGKKLRKAGVKDRGQFEMLALTDVMIGATEGFYVNVNGKPEELSAEDGPWVERWEQLAEYLGYNGEEKTARACLYWVFAGNEFAIGNHGITLNRWFGNTGSEVDAEFLGEAGR